MPKKSVKKPLKRKKAAIRKPVKKRHAKKNRSNAITIKSLLKRSPSARVKKPATPKPAGTRRRKVRGFIHYPLLLKVGGRLYLMNSMNFRSRKFRDICDLAAKEQDVSFSFNSSQAPHVFDKIYKITDIFIKGLSEKIDPLLRELVKNAEKENATHIAKKAGLIPQDVPYASLDTMRRILNETVYDKNNYLPILYYYPEINVSLRMYVRNNTLYFEIENYGSIQPHLQEMISKRIQLGREIALFDLEQEFKMRDYPDVSDRIRDFFRLVFRQEQVDRLWQQVFGESFDDYWSACPYFLMIRDGVHSSLFPHFVAAFIQLNMVLLAEDRPHDEHFSAGMGYIKCAFVIEANRSLYGTYGKITIPANKGEKTLAGFIIGMPDIVINFKTIS